MYSFDNTITCQSTLNRIKINNNWLVLVLFKDETDKYKIINTANIKKKNFFKFISDEGLNDQENDDEDDEEGDSSEDERTLLEKNCLSLNESSEEMNENGEDCYSCELCPQHDVHSYRHLTQLKVTILNRYLSN